MPLNHYHQLQIAAIITETSEAKTFILKPLHQWQPVYAAGQFLTLLFQTKHGEKRRSYSISSSPALDEPLSITVKRMENGEFSRVLLAHAKTGDVLNATDVSGLFVLPQSLQETRQFFFMAAGSGITPCFAMIKTLLYTTGKKVVLIYSNKNRQQTIFFQQLNLLQQQFSNRFQIHFLFSTAIDIYEGRLSNWLLQQLLIRYLQVPKSNALFYLCGPFEYMQMISITLLSEGNAQQNIRKENFNALPHLVKPAPPDKAAHIVTVHFQNQLHQLSVQYPQSILAVAKANKISIPYSCEAGRCGSCAATCTLGKIWMAYNEVLMDDEIASGRILCCQAYPIGGDATIVVG